MGSRRAFDTVAIVPARWQSRRAPNKNIAALGNKPLVEWTISAALASTLISHVVVTTDDARIMEIAAGFAGVDVIARPPELAKEDSDIWDAVRHAITGFDCRLVVLLQPTSPFRTAADIDEACRLRERGDGDAVVSVTRSPPDAAFSIGHAGRLRPITDGWVENGALWVLTAAAVHNRLDLYSNEAMVYAYPMPPERSIDIDTLAQLEAARAYLARGELGTAAA